MAYPVEIPDPRIRVIALLTASVLAMVWCIAGFIPGFTADAVEIDSFVYVNTDPIESLIRLPGTGVKSAENIIDYRNASTKPKAFENAGDLCEVNGIAEKKAQIMLPYISFE